MTQRSSSHDKLSLLARVPLLTELSQAALEELAAHLQVRRYRRGEVVCSRGDPGNMLYLVGSGRVKASVTSPDGREVILALLGPGEFFGLVSLLDGEPLSADLVAQEPCDLLLLPRADFVNCLETTPTAAVRLLVAVSKRLRYTSQMVQDAATLDVGGRVARVLLDLAQWQEAESGEPVEVRTRLTQSELAALIGATRESVNKWLGFYERRGLIRRDGDRITVTRPDQLHQRIA